MIILYEPLLIYGSISLPLPSPPPAALTFKFTGHASIICILSYLGPMFAGSVIEHLLSTDECMTPYR